MAYLKPYFEFDWNSSENNFIVLPLEVDHDVSLLYIKKVHANALTSRSDIIRKLVQIDIIKDPSIKLDHEEILKIVNKYVEIVEILELNTRDLRKLQSAKTRKRSNYRKNLRERREKEFKINQQKLLDKFIL